MTESSSTRSSAPDPWSQAITAGVLALIPSRKYPVWLRQTLTWGTTAGVVALVSAPGAASEILKRVSKQEAERVELGSAARAVVALGAGTLMYGSWRFAWWFDEAAEQALRNLRVPFPRAVMGAAVGALHWRSAHRERRKPEARPVNEPAAHSLMIGVSERNSDDDPFSVSASNLD